jgi:hypothetical protein
MVQHKGAAAVLEHRHEMSQLPLADTPQDMAAQAALCRSSPCSSAAQLLQWQRPQNSSPVHLHLSRGWARTTVSSPWTYHA